MTTFVLIGSGWRARMFLKVARELGTICGGVVVRTPRRLDVPVFTSLDACLREVRPGFVLTATPSHVTPSVIGEAVDRGLPVIAETPPAPDLHGLRGLWSAVGGSGLVQVAEQYLMMPSHAARAAIVATGVIGTPTQVQVSSTLLADCGCEVGRVGARCGEGAGQRDGRRNVQQLGRADVGPYGATALGVSDRALTLSEVRPLQLLGLRREPASLQAEPRTACPAAWTTASKAGEWGPRLVCCGRSA